MVVLLLVLLFGLALAYFATQNTTLTSIVIGPYLIADLPLYLVVLGALVLGAAVSGLLYSLHTLTSSLELNDKKKQINALKNELAEITRATHKLELQNTKLKTKLGEDDFDEDSI